MLDPASATLSGAIQTFTGTVELLPPPWIINSPLRLSVGLAFDATNGVFGSPEGVVVVPRRFFTAGAAPDGSDWWIVQRWSAGSIDQLYKSDGKDVAVSDLPRLAIVLTDGLNRTVAAVPLPLPPRPAASSEDAAVFTYQRISLATLLQRVQAKSKTKAGFAPRLFPGLWRAAVVRSVKRMAVVETTDTGVKRVTKTSSMTRVKIATTTFAVVTPDFPWLGSLDATNTAAASTTTNTTDTVLTGRSLVLARLRQETRKTRVMAFVNSSAANSSASFSTPTVRISSPVSRVTGMGVLVSRNIQLKALESVWKAVNMRQASEYGKFSKCVPAAATPEFCVCNS
jgi:hypothetical protein